MIQCLGFLCCIFPCVNYLKSNAEFLLHIDNILVFSWKREQIQASSLYISTTTLQTVFLTGDSCCASFELSVYLPLLPKRCHANFPKWRACQSASVKPENQQSLCFFSCSCWWVRRRMEKSRPCCQGTQYDIIILRTELQPEQQIPSYLTGSSIGPFTNDCILNEHAKSGLNLQVTGTPLTFPLPPSLGKQRLLHFGSFRSEQLLFPNCTLDNTYAQNSLRKPLPTARGRMENTQDSPGNGERSEGANTSSIKKIIFCKIF